MANPQVENGYVRIATELQKALARTRINGESRQVLDAIILFTYGWHRKKATIGTFQLMRETGLPKWSVERARKDLRARRIITTSIDASSKGSQVLCYQIKKDYHVWQTKTKRIGKGKGEVAIKIKAGLTEPSLAQLPASKPAVLPAKMPAVLPAKTQAVLPASMRNTKDTSKDTSKDKNPGPSAASADLIKTSLDKVYKDGFNIYQALEKVRLLRKQPKGARFPDAVLLELCDQYWKYKPKIKDQWPWFIRVLRSIADKWHANNQISEHHKLKNAEVAPAVKDILKSIGEGTSG